MSREEVASVLRHTLLAASRSDRARKLITTAPLSRGIVARYVAGESAGDALRVASELAGDGLLVSLDRLGEDDTLDRGLAEATTEAYVELLHQLRDAGLMPAAEVSVKLSAVGRRLGSGGESLAYDNAARI